MSEEVKSEETAAPEEEPKKGPAWEYKKDFAINNTMREVIGLTVSAAEAEINVLKRKLAKLQYGA